MIKNEWTRSFVWDPGFYSGRGQNAGDLNGRILNQIHAGLLQENDNAGKRFPAFVESLPDLSASAFIVQFEAWERAGFPEVAEPVPYRGGLDGSKAYGNGLVTQAFCCLLATSRNDPRSAILAGFPKAVRP